MLLRPGDQALSRVVGERALLSLLLLSTEVDRRMRRSAKELGVGRGDWDADREDEEDSEAPTLLVPSEGGVDALLVLFLLLLLVVVVVATPDVEELEDLVLLEGRGAVDVVGSLAG